MLKLSLTCICFLVFSCINSKVYAQDGSLDLSFNTDGLVTTALGTFDDKIHGIAIQSDGKIVAAGIMHNTMNYDFAVARYNTNGSLDSTFGTGGLVSTGIELLMTKAEPLQFNRMVKLLWLAKVIWEPEMFLP